MSNFAWWTELTHGGIVISNPVLTEQFKEKKVNPDSWKYKRFRDNYNAFISKELTYSAGTHPVHSWITNIFVELLGTDKDHWLRGQNIPPKYSIITKTGIPIKPNRVLVENDTPILLLKRDESPRLGMHKGRRSYAQFVELLRKTNVSLGILTNGHQIRLVYAGLDHDAWIQWQVDAWFDEGETRHQLDGFITILNPKLLKIEDESFPLLDAVNLSRSRQADLADVLGDQIRQAVELLTTTIGRVQQQNTTFLDTVKIAPRSSTSLSEKETLTAIYQAATRLVMRKVIVFYAEAKELLPNENLFYHDNYSLEGMYSQLANTVQQSGIEDLKSRYSAWPRLLALFQMVHSGSEHEVLPLKAYGGTLFKKGDAGNSDAVLRALSLFEDPAVQISDYEIYSILRLIKIGKTKVRQGRGSTWVSGPVDFSDLRTEYIGMMYEGLLDYELKIVDQNDPKVILGIGDQPILPLKILEPMDDVDIKNLFKKMKVESDSAAEEVIEETIEETDQDLEHIDDSTVYGKTLRWAVKAVEVASLVRRPQGAVAQQVYEQKKLERARKLIIKVLEPDEMYLVCWGGTRKGSGTFYTKPALAIPTVQRTLEPLVYDIEVENKTPKLPRDILDLKICDPAVGSGTFAVAAARYLTDVLLESVLKHILVDRDDEGNIGKVPSEIHLSADVVLEPPPLKPTDDGWEEQLQARLKRLVVERCLFGVDYNGMAIELTRLSMWLETMDKELPFEFLDHRFKQGNSLIGTWFSQYLNYPAKAWDREDGNGNKNRNKEILQSIVKPELINLIKHGGQSNLFDQQDPADVIINKLMDSWKELSSTNLFDSEKREEIYKTQIINDKDLIELKHQFDKWCSIWFWPSENEDLSIISPSNYFTANQTLSDIVEELSSRFHFFHWELEFPEVFTKTDNREKTGFDAIIGNPPWATQKSDSKQFFSNYDPIYSTYDRVFANQRSNEMIDYSPEIKNEWCMYNGYYKALSNYTKNAHKPYDVGLNSDLNKSWEFKRNSQKHQHCKITPYKYQGGGDINLYKLFLEQVHNLLNDKGRLGFIFPAGFMIDQGSKSLRELYFEKSHVELLYGFWNKKRIFPIVDNQRFCVIIIDKGSTDKVTNVAFDRKELSLWEKKDLDTITLEDQFIEKVSPINKSIIQVESQIDADSISHIYDYSVTYSEYCDLNDINGYKREFDMTNHRDLFEASDNIQLESYQSIPGICTNGNNLYFPFYTGRLIYLCDFAAKKWISGHGRGARYEAITFQKKDWIPEYVMPIENTNIKWNGGVRLVCRDLTDPTNERTVISTLIPAWPCSNKVPVLIDEDELDIISLLKLFAVLSSFIFDYVCRMKMVGINLNKFILDELPIPDLNKIPDEACILIARYAFPHKIFAKSWKLLLDKFPDLNCREWGEWFAISEYDRMYLRAIIETIVSKAYEFNREKDTLISHILTPDINRPKSFHKYDSHLPLEERLPMLSLKCIKENYEQKSIDLIGKQFCGNWTLHLKSNSKINNKDIGGNDLSWGICAELAALYESLGTETVVLN